jgi:hypothetical protein
MGGDLACQVGLAARRTEHFEDPEQESPERRHGYDSLSRGLSMSPVVIVPSRRQYLRNHRRTRLAALASRSARTKT